MRSSRRRFLQATAGAAIGSVAGRLAGAAQSSGPPVVRFLGKRFLNNPVGVTGADGATSLVLPSGDSLWVFGDTVEGPFESIHGLDLAPLRSNTGAIVPQQDASAGIAKFQFLATPDGR